VFGWTEIGAYAEYAVGSRLFLKPTGLSWEAAAALPIAGETSERVLDQLAVGAGDTLLIHSASGAVGTLALQLAVRRGATVVGTASEVNHRYLTALGALPTTYGDGLWNACAPLRPTGSTRCSTWQGTMRWPTRSSYDAAPAASSPSRTSPAPNSTGS
jgi:NADPH:quinone reductase-like Zn-dependent oxidoreductase